MVWFGISSKQKWKGNELTILTIPNTCMYDIIKPFKIDHFLVEMIEGKANGLTDGRTDGQTDRRTDRRTDILTSRDAKFDQVLILDLSEI